MAGVSKILPPLTIVEGITVDYKLHFHMIFREFAQTYKGMRNDMTPKTIDAIALEPNSNMQSSVRCCSLATGRVLQRQ